MIYAGTFVGFVILAIAAVTLLGPLAGPIAWLLVYGLVQVIVRLGLHYTDPARAYDRERAATPTRLSATAWRSTTSPRLQRSRMAAFSSRLRRRRRSRP